MERTPPTSGTAAPVIRRAGLALTPPPNISANTVSGEAHDRVAYSEAELRTLTQLDAVKWVAQAENQEHPRKCLTHAEWDQPDLFGQVVTVSMCLLLRGRR